MVSAYILFDNGYRYTDIDIIRDEYYLTENESLKLEQQLYNIELETIYGISIFAEV